MRVSMSLAVAGALVCLALVQVASARHTGSQHRRPQTSSLRDREQDERRTELERADQTEYEDNDASSEQNRDSDDQHRRVKSYERDEDSERELEADEDLRSNRQHDKQHAKNRRGRYNRHERRQDELERERDREQRVQSHDNRHDNNNDDDDDDDDADYNDDSVEHEHERDQDDRRRHRGNSNEQLHRRRTHLSRRPQAASARGLSGVSNQYLEDEPNSVDYQDGLQSRQHYRDVPVSHGGHFRRPGFTSSVHASRDKGFYLNANANKNLRKHNLRSKHAQAQAGAEGHLEADKHLSGHHDKAANHKHSVHNNDKTFVNDKSSGVNDEDYTRDSTGFNSDSHLNAGGNKFASGELDTVNERDVEANSNHGLNLGGHKRKQAGFTKSFNL